MTLQELETNREFISVVERYSAWFSGCPFEVLSFLYEELVFPNKNNLALDKENIKKTILELFTIKNYSRDQIEPLEYLLLTQLVLKNFISSFIQNEGKYEIEQAKSPAHGKIIGRYRFNISSEKITFGLIIHEDYENKSSISDMITNTEISFILHGKKSVTLSEWVKDPQEIVNFLEG